MADEREDDQPNSSDRSTDGGFDGGDAYEEIRIAEMSPPPPPLESDDPTSIAPRPPDRPMADPTVVEPDPDPRAVVPVGPGPDPALMGRGVDPLHDRTATAPWPSSAKVAVALLAVLALLGVAGTIIGFSRASSANDDVEALEAELSTAEDRIVALEDQLASLGDETGGLSIGVDQLTTERDDARAELDDARAELDDARAELDDARAELDDAQAERDAAIIERDEAVADRDEQVAVAEAEEARLQSQVEALEAQLGETLNGVDEFFPVTVESDLGPAELAGTYDVSFVEIGCSGLDLCGSTPGPAAAAITSAGGLRLIVPDLFDVPLVVVDGTPFGVADSQSIVGPCGGVARTASLTMALFDDGRQIDQGGRVAVTSLGATIVVDAPAVDDCEIGRVWYRASLVPQG